jgi:hypothetical protein
LLRSAHMSPRALLLPFVISCSNTVADRVDDQPDGRLGADCGQSPLDLNDVSFLFPLPDTFADLDGLLGLDSKGPAGTLLPVAARAGLPAHLERGPDSVDPCFAATPGECRKQVRLVAQPFHPTESPPRVIDATVHLFYDLGDSQFAELVAGLRALKQRAGAMTACQPLQVHPVMVKEGLGGEYASEVERLILQFAGDTTLSRVAVMRLGAVGETSLWFFSAFDRVDGAWSASPIPQLGATVEQEFRRSFFHVQEPPAINPHPTGVNLIPLLDATWRVAATAAEVQPLFDLAFRIENPVREAASSVDCVSCHISDRARRVTDEERGEVRSSPELYSNAAFDLRVVSTTTGLEVQRAFGYFGRDASVNQRVINESAEVATKLGELP